MPLLVHTEQNKGSILLLLCVVLNSMLMWWNQMGHVPILHMDIVVLKGHVLSWPEELALLCWAICLFNGCLISLLSLWLLDPTVHHLLCSITNSSAGTTRVLCKRLTFARVCALQCHNLSLCIIYSSIWWDKRIPCSVATVGPKSTVHQPDVQPWSSNSKLYFVSNSLGNVSITMLTEDAECHETLNK